MNATSPKTYYETLGVEPCASADEIRKAYLKLAHKHHPDKTGGDKAAEEQLKEINAAYDTLKNPEKRKKYDLELEAQQRGHAGFGGFEDAFRGGFDPGGFEFSGFGGGGFEDIFGSLFGSGGMRRPAGPETGADLEAAITISLEEAFNGVRKTARIRRPEACSLCGGSGAEPGTAWETCSTCGGSGQLAQSRAGFSVRTTCPHCYGEGSLLKNPCKQCSGHGQTQAERTITVEIPAGVDTGARLRLPGQGAAGLRGGPAGDLYVHIGVQAHEFFKRQGNDLVCDVPLSITQAALGDRVRVPTITGVADLNIPEGTQNGARFRMRGQGMPRLAGGGRGDQIVRVEVEIPVRLNQRQKALLRELAEQAGEQHEPKRRGFLARLKGLGAA
ncbi:MAG: molecular chaperone DnaJ [Candidatus Hydrogenedentes bacterium]|nr:molecular chaperone DnaJ [Candidatus Hydrogenedentota bacterium]